MNNIYKIKYKKYKLKYNNLKKIINGGGLDGMVNTGSINMQLHIKNNSPIYNKLINLLTQIDKRLEKVETRYPKKIYVNREFHISLFTIVYNKDLPYTQTPDFKTKLNSIQTNLDCLTRTYIEKNFIENLKLNLFKEFTILGTKGFLDSFITQTINIDEYTKNIFSNLKKNICLYLFGNTHYIDSDRTDYKNLDEKTSYYYLDEKTSYYYPGNNPLYKIKKIYNFDKDDYKCHISYTKINVFSKLAKSTTSKNLKKIADHMDTENKKEIEQIFYNLYDDTKVDESFKTNYEFSISKY